ncbi:hypothetical protein ElyMa_001737500 [Elysia marginata]|uniref:Uncharacterized protein n=1 Tax=Elysia marginata TaxID=1093978 RepID=A0AAV4JYG2_9GAST|nr:hypothetical protein ElyMa_001737500 [Elysia marginata]
MTKYFKTEGSKQRGRPKTSIVTTLRRDLKSHNSDHWSTRLHTVNDLDHLRDIAHNISVWKHLTIAIYRSAQAETSVDIAADGHSVIGVNTYQQHIISTVGVNTYQQHIISTTVGVRTYQHLTISTTVGVNTYQQHV